MGAAILAAVGRLHTAAAMVRDVLRAVADAQHGQVPHKLAQVDLKCLPVVHRERRTAQNHANHAGVINGKLVIGKNLAEGVEFAHPPPNELGGLRAEVKDDNLLLHAASE